jgi:outer membrane protein assembly factor BamE (lipoprotein component of BamABCDE complex)
MTHLNRLIFILCLTIIAGCQSIDMRGQFVSNQEIKEINSEKPDKEKLIDKIGNPTYIPDYSPNTWYYLQRSLVKKAWFNPKVVEQRIVRVTLNKNKVLRAELLENTHNDNIFAHGDFTKTYGTEQTGIQKFVKNFGRFNKTNNSAKKRK